MFYYLLTMMIIFIIMWFFCKFCCGGDTNNMFSNSHNIISFYCRTRIFFAREIKILQNSLKVYFEQTVKRNETSCFGFHGNDKPLTSSQNIFIMIFKGQWGGALRSESQHFYKFFIYPTHGTVSIQEGEN